MAHDSFEIAHGGMSDVTTISMTVLQLELIERMALHLNGTPKQFTAEELKAMKEFGMCARGVLDAPIDRGLIHDFCL